MTQENRCSERTDTDRFPLAYSDFAFTYDRLPNEAVPTEDFRAPQPASNSGLP